MDVRITQARTLTYAQLEELETIFRCIGHSIYLLENNAPNRAKRLLEAQFKKIEAYKADDTYPYPVAATEIE